MKQSRVIKTVSKDELGEALALVNRVFAALVAPDYSSAGQKTFSEYLKVKEAEMTADLAYGHKEMWCMAQGKPGKIIGVIAMRGKTHIALLFVDQAYQRQGIATELFSFVRGKLLLQEAEKITVNSSPYACPVYHRWGFQDTGPEQELNGIRFTPMEYLMAGEKR